MSEYDSSLRIEKITKTNTIIENRNEIVKQKYKKKNINQGRA
jgi:hypothetical protein